MAFDRNDFGTLVLFSLLGPFVGSAAYGLIAGGPYGMLAGPMLIFFGFAFGGPLGWYLFGLIGLLPGLCAALLGLAVRRAGYPRLFIPAAVLGGSLAIAAVSSLGDTPLPGAFYGMACAGAILCGAADLLLRWHEARQGAPSA